MATADEHDDAFGYADAMACGLAAVVLLLFASLMQLSGGTGRSEAYASLSVQFAFPAAPKVKGASAEVAFAGRRFADIGPDGVVTARRVGLIRTGRSLQSERVTLDTPPDAAPALNLSLDEWPKDATEGRWVWKTSLLVRYAAAAESFDWAWTFDGGTVPVEVSVALTDHTCSTDKPIYSLEPRKVAGTTRLAVRIRVDEGVVQIADWEVR